PQLAKTVWVGMSAGSMVMTPRIGRDFVGWRPAAGDGDDSALGLVDFSICPHLAPDGQPGNSRAAAEGWASKLDTPAYAIDDQTAVTVVDGDVRVVSEGEWMPFPR
ncbi:MAG: Type 1 glutamine amidotransferase-like domain-containing protein, partial [Microbacteriaceae bacterium]|nr:Type 1 glutamine amidotransferase-like domain-containing protein [Microbacteriaceae bacterium]